MNNIEQKQVQMHKDFFERCEVAIENSFYFEAILMEYAAIESRLEAICGVINLPCGKDCPNKKDIKISARIECLRVCRKKHENTAVFSKTKLPNNFYTKNGLLKKWIDSRNKIVHGLFKEELKYSGRVQNSRKLAKDGLDYARLLYNETKRIRRLKKSHPEVFENIFSQCISNCKGKKE